MKELNEGNTHVFKNEWILRIEVHTNVDLEEGDEVSVNGQLPFKVMVIRDLLTEKDRQHGDVISKHLYLIYLPVP